MIIKRVATMVRKCTPGELTIATVIFATFFCIFYLHWSRRGDLKISARPQIRQRLRWRDTKDLIGLYFFFNEYWPDSVRYIPVYA